MQKLLLKGIGALCLLATGAAAGRMRGEREIRRVCAMQEMVDVLTALYNDLRFQQNRTYDALCRAIRTNTPKTLFLQAELLQDGPQFAHSMETMLAQLRYAHAAELHGEEIDVFCDALAKLGTASAQQAQQAMLYAASRLESMLHAARTQAQQLRQLYRTVGISAGGAAALLLL
jgi:stage III sporulation protein AB